MSGNAYYAGTVYDNCMVDFGWGTASYVEDQCTMYWDTYQNSYRYFGKDCNEEKSQTYEQAKSQSRDYCAMKIDTSLNCSDFQGKFWYYHETEIGLVRLGNEVIFTGCEQGYSWFRGTVDDQCLFDFYYWVGVYSEEQCTMYWDGYGWAYRYFNQECNANLDPPRDFDTAKNTKTDFCERGAKSTSDICPDMAGTFYYYHGERYVIKRDGNEAIMKNCEYGYEWFKFDVREDCTWNMMYFTYYGGQFDTDSCAWSWPNYPDSYRYFDKSCMAEKGQTWQDATGYVTWFYYYSEYVAEH